MRAGTSSSMAELIAEYSPPMPAPAKKRQTAKTQQVGDDARQRRGDEVEHERDEEQALAAERSVRWPKTSAPATSPVR